MSLNNEEENEIQVESEYNDCENYFSKYNNDYDYENYLSECNDYENLSDNDSNSLVIDLHKDCHRPPKKIWCEKCIPHDIIKWWTSGNNNIDELIKDTIYCAKRFGTAALFLEWVPFDKFTNLKQIGGGGFAKVYSATWIDGNGKWYSIHGAYGSWRKSDLKPMKVALKKLNGSQNISAEYLNKIKMYWKFYSENIDSSLKLYGITKDPKTEEFMMIMQFANKGNLRCTISSDFNNILWYDKIKLLWDLIFNLINLHELEYSHTNFHCGNILQDYNSESKACYSYISDFGLFGPSNEQKSDDKVYGVLPYIAPEVLNGEKYTLSSDIYSFGIIMTELSSGKPPFYEIKHDSGLALDICNGLRPEFGEGTPEIYKKLACRCMDANPDQRPTAIELNDLLHFWIYSFYDYHQDNEKFGYKGKEIKAIFKEADKEIPNISTSYEKNPDAIYISRAFTFNNLSEPINSSIIASHHNDNKDCPLEVADSFQLNDIDSDN